MTEQKFFYIFNESVPISVPIARAISQYYNLNPTCAFTTKQYKNDNIANFVYYGKTRIESEIDSRSHFL